MAAKGAKKCGRPSSFTPIIAEQICVKVMEGMGLERVGDLEGFPSTTTMYRWLGSEGDQFEAFREKYARACEVRAGARFEKLREWGEKAAEGRLDPAAARAAADIEKWCLARENPRKYGDAMTLKGDKDNPLRIGKPIDLDERALLAIAAGDQALDG
jgi:hypothetical protein